MHMQVPASVLLHIASLCEEYSGGETRTIADIGLRVGEKVGIIPAIMNFMTTLVVACSIESSIRHPETCSTTAEIYLFPHSVLVSCFMTSVDLTPQNTEMGRCNVAWAFWMGL